MTAPQIKCVIWDLDNVLWQGTLLEANDVVLTPGIETIVQELDNRGILQSVASKNDHHAATEKLVAFGLHHFFLCPQIGWGNKSDSIRAITEALRIDLRTVAFVDDEPFERDEVNHFLPDVLTIDSADIGQLLRKPRLRPRFVTDESKMRRKMCAADIARDKARDCFPGSTDDFLKTLAMCVTIRRAGELDLKRVEELTIRTNQLNSTGRLYSYEELTRLLNSRDHTILVARLDDRYGASGTVGLALITERPRFWYLNLLTVSCRVMTRGVAGIMMSYLLQSAKQNSVTLRAEFVPTHRNRIMYITYKFNGFYEIGDADDRMILEHNLRNIRPFPRYVTVRSTD